MKLLLIEDEPMLLLAKQRYVSEESYLRATYEMQTPLAVTSSELENLPATEPLTKVQIDHVQRTPDSIQRLVRLNKSLLLLTQIENHQFMG